MLATRPQVPRAQPTIRSDPDIQLLHSMQREVMQVARIPIQLRLASVERAIQRYRKQVGRKRKSQYTCNLIREANKRRA